MIPTVADSSRRTEVRGPSVRRARDYAGSQRLGCESDGPTVRLSLQKEKVGRGGRKGEGNKLHTQMKTSVGPSEPSVTVGIPLDPSTTLRPGLFASLLAKHLPLEPEESLAVPTRSRPSASNDRDSAPAP